MSQSDSEREQQKNKIEMVSDSEVGDDEGMSDDDIINTDQTFCQRLRSVIGNKTYLLVCMSVTFLYYIITGL